MTSPTEQVAAQLAEELGAAAHALAVLAGPDESIRWEQTLRARAPMHAAQIVQDHDDAIAAETVIDVMNALWPHANPEECGRADWWTTPLGRMCARSLGFDSCAVTQSVAAAMLGVTRGTVATLVHRGTLDRHPDGGVTRASVLARLARMTGGERYLASRLDDPDYRAAYEAEQGGA